MCASFCWSQIVIVSLLICPLLVIWYQILMYFSSDMLNISLSILAGHPAATTLSIW